MGHIGTVACALPLVVLLPSPGFCHTEDWDAAPTLLLERSVPASVLGPAQEEEEEEENGGGGGAGNPSWASRVAKRPPCPCLLPERTCCCTFLPLPGGWGWLPCGARGAWSHRGCFVVSPSCLHVCVGSPGQPARFRS